MNIKEFLSIKTQDALYLATSKICYKDKTLLESYLKRRISDLGAYGMYPYYLHPLYNEVSVNFRSRFLIVDFDSDSVAVFFKYIFVIKTKYFRMYEHPISLSGNKDNELLVENHLKSTNVIKQVVYADSTSTDPHDFDFFAKVQETFERISVNAWRAEHKVNKASKMDISFQLATDEDKDEMLKMYNLWAEYKDGVSKSKMTPNLIKRLGKDGIIGLLVKYKGVIISSDIYYSMFDGEFLYGAVQNNIGRLPVELLKVLIPDASDDELTFLKRRISDIDFYHSMKYFNSIGIKSVYVGGSGHGKTLLENKSRLFPYKILYNIEVVE